MTVRSIFVYIFKTLELFAIRAEQRSATKQPLHRKTVRTDTNLLNRVGSPADGQDLRPLSGWLVGSGRLRPRYPELGPDAVILVPSQHGRERNARGEAMRDHRRQPKSVVRSHGWRRPIRRELGPCGHPGGELRFP